MTPASSNRYQSRLFRFAYKQSRRFTQQCDRAWRNLQSTASWVASVGMYPIFLLLQSRQSTANQVHQAVEATLRQLPADDAVVPESPTVDTPIRQVLLCVTEVAESQKSKVKSQNLPATPHTLLTTTHYSPLTTHSIRGIASQLASRNLVLVTAQNQTLDVIDPQQQAALQEQIMTAIAEYWQYRRRQDRSPLPTPNSRLRGANNEETTLSTRFPTPPWLTSLDHTVAEVESHHLVRVKSAAIAFYQSIFSQSTDIADSERSTAEVRTEASGKTHTTRILSLIWAAIDYFFGTDDATKPSITPGTTHKGVYSHLKGTIPVNHRFPPRRPTAKLPASHNLADEDLEDPWLTASDLFGSVTPQTTGDRSLPTFTLPANSSVEYALPHERGRLGQFLSKIRAPKDIVKQQQTSDPPNPPYKGGQQSTPEISRLQNRASRRILLPFSRGVGESGSHKKISPPFSRRVGKIESRERISPPFSRGVGGIEPRTKSAEISKTSKGKQSLRKAEPSNISTSTTQNSSVQSTPDWIETPATLMGYVKHPLEQILAWLDRTMLWIEEIFLKFWQWMHKLWRKF